MFTRNKTFSSFDRTQKSFGFIGVNCMLNVLLVSNCFQIIQFIIASIKVFVIDLQTSFNTAIKRFPNHSVHAFFGVFSVFTQTSNPVAFKQENFYRPMRRVSSPSFTLLNGMRGGYTRTQKSSNFFKGSAVFKHLFSVWNFGGVKRFASGDSAHAPKVAYFVKPFKIQNWFPCFHTMPLFNVNRSIA